MIPAWASDYIGIRFAPGGRTRESGVDCWGLLRLIYSERFGVELPSFLGYDLANRPPAMGPYISSRIDDRWNPVKPGDERPGDVLVFRVGNFPSHVALVIAPGFMLHVFNGADSCIEAITVPRWKTRLVGIYRHEGLQHGCASNIPGRLERQN